MTPIRRIDGVLFDFDGTLTEPGSIDFAAVRKALGCPLDRYLIEFIAGLPSGARRDEAQALLARYEEEGAARSRPAPGAEDLIVALKADGLPVGLLTRNALAAVERALANFERITIADFDIVLTRDDPVAPKPAPDAVLVAAGHMGIDAGNLLMVGDFILDVQAGRAAGAVTAYIEPARRPTPAPTAADYFDSRPGPGDCDFFIAGLGELLELVRATRV
jgi:hydrogenase expression/formation protein HypE